MAGEGILSVHLGKSLQKYHGEELISVETEKSEGIGEKQYVGLYFSASWCPPCKAFTPKLVEFHKKMKKADANKFEIVFVSSDRDEGSFQEYAKHMPWLALPYSERDKKTDLSKKFKVSGIPTLMILDGKTGELITDKGRENVSSDPEGAMFPWRPKSIQEIWSGEDVSPGDKDKFVKGDFPENLEGKVVGLYFSAHWCPPCRDFTPKLAIKYKQLKEAGKPFEIVFMSADRSEDEYNEYFSEMDWLALPYKDPRISSFNTKFEVQGIPALVILSAEGKLITTGGRSAMDSKTFVEDFPFKAKMINPVSERFVDTLQESKCVIYFTDSSDDAKNAEAAMSSLAKDYYKDGDEQTLYFYTGVTDDGVGKGLYDYLKPEKPRCLVITDLAENAVYRHKAGDDWTLSEGSFREFITEFNDKKIEVSKLG